MMYSFPNPHCWDLRVGMLFVSLPRLSAFNNQQSLILSMDLNGHDIGERQLHMVSTGAI